ncbi:Uma2 family endonuclease [Trichocoleus sp. FACHB-90]|uniref:Uma2 family endonuclease n=1 Tax=Cyanophyceae TaxID=3028117 RepID=UPI00168A33C9|nr:Uma2 family endonuclease [Trichocoleus sp. FACHB-90]MBD1927535.1 Uma2 family endonuclease [Trichocoleus sp. FACHB-90]
MVQYNPLQYLPTEEDLPDSDDTPVDNEFQIIIPFLLRAILSLLWAERMDWFFGVNMGVYYDLKESAIVPDGFLSLGVPRRKSDRGRLSYVIWQEQVVPQLVFEFVSQTKGGEYDDKMTKYSQIGVLYYVIYNPDYYRRDKHDSFEVYRLENGVYIRQFSNPVWMPEIQLGIGCEPGTHDGFSREWLYWYDSNSNRFPAPENVIQQERQRAEAERQRADRAEQQLAELMAKLQERGIDLEGL